jgi:hypothetical protein
MFLRFVATGIVRVFKKIDGKENFYVVIPRRYYQTPDLRKIFGINIILIEDVGSFLLRSHSRNVNQVTHGVRFIIDVIIGSRGHILMVVAGQGEGIVRTRDLG